MDFKNIKGKPNYLFDNLEEYQAFGFTDAVLDDWRAGNEGDWVYTDDRYICPNTQKKFGKPSATNTTNNDSHGVRFFHIRTEKS